MAALQYHETLRTANHELADWCNSELSEWYDSFANPELTLKLEQFVLIFVQDLAFELSLSALLGENIYNFGELLVHPLIKSVLGTQFEWLYHILQAFNSGDLVRYQELCRVHNAALSAQPALVLVGNENKLLEKISIICLMELIFSRPSENRTILSSVIAEHTKLSIQHAEHLLMKSLSVHLIEGIIDQVDGTVHVSWVQPIVLEIPQVKSLKARLDKWVDKVHSGTALLSMEAASNVYNPSVVDGQLYLQVQSPRKFASPAIKERNIKRPNEIALERFYLSLKMAAGFQVEDIGRINKLHNHHESLVAEMRRCWRNARPGDLSDLDYIPGIMTPFPELTNLIEYRAGEEVLYPVQMSMEMFLVRLSTVRVYCIDWDYAV